MQEAALNAWRNLDRFEERSSFKTWITRITVNEALSSLRSLEKTLEGKATSRMEDNAVQTDEGESLAMQARASGKDPYEFLLQTESGKRIYAAIEKLKPIYKIAFLLTYVDGLSIEEAANVLEISTGAVKSRQLRARLALKEFLTKDRVGFVTLLEANVPVAFSAASNEFSQTSLQSPRPQQIQVMPVSMACVM